MLTNADHDTLGESGQTVLPRFTGFWEEAVSAAAIKGQNYRFWMEAIVRDGTFVPLELDYCTSTVQQTNIQRSMDKSVILCLSLSVISWRKRSISIDVLFVFFRL